MRRGSGPVDAREEVGGNDGGGEDGEDQGVDPPEVEGKDDGYGEDGAHDLRCVQVAYVIRM